MVSGGLRLCCPRARRRGRTGSRQNHQFSPVTHNKQLTLTATAFWSWHLQQTGPLMLSLRIPDSSRQSKLQSIFFPNHNWLLIDNIVANSWFLSVCKRCHLDSLCAFPTLLFSISAGPLIKQFHRWRDREKWNHRCFQWNESFISFVKLHPATITHPVQNHRTFRSGSHHCYCYYRRW